MIRQTLLKILKPRIGISTQPCSLNNDSNVFEINNWDISQFIIKHLLHISGTHPYPLEELSLMCASLNRVRPTHIFDWGTHIGKSARIFHEISKKFTIPCEIHTIDLPPDKHHIEHPHNKVGILIRGIPNIHQHFGDGIEIATTIALSLPPKSRLLFFADGDHSFESVLHELNSIYKHFPSASILIHDTFYQEPMSGYNIGPWRAIQEFTKGKEHCYQIIATQLGLPGMTLLYAYEK